MCKSNIIFSCVCLHPSSVHLSVILLLLNHWMVFNQTCYITFPDGKVCKSNFIFPCVCPCIRPSVRHVISKSTGLNSTSHATLLPLMVRICKSNNIFTSVHPSVGPSSAHCPSHYFILDHWVEFKQTCYITSPHGKSVQVQHYLEIWFRIVNLTVICPHHDTVNVLKFLTPESDKMTYANSADPDQTAPEGAV